MTARLKFPRGLYGVTPDWTDADRLESAVRQAIAGGMVALQLRHKTATAEFRRDLALRLLPVCREAGVPLLINDDWQLALDIKADGIHLGQHDEDPQIVRAEVGDDMMIGVSCYASLARAQSLLRCAPVYIAFGAMFASETKPLAPPASLSVLGEALTLTTVLGEPRPGVAAIGGINLSNARPVIEAGATSLAVVGGLFHTTDIKNTAQAFSELFN